MFNYSKIAYLLNKNKVTKIQLCAHIKMTTQGYDKMVRNNSMKIETLERIADFFETPIAYFFNVNENVIKEAEEGYEKVNYKAEYFKLLEENRELNKQLIELLKKKGK